MFQTQIRHSIATLLTANNTQPTVDRTEWKRVAKIKIDCLSHLSPGNFSTLTANNASRAEAANDITRHSPAAYRRRVSVTHKAVTIPP
jgi:hypothetical protein